MLEKIKMTRTIKHILSGLILASVIMAAVFVVLHRKAQLNAMPPPTKIPLPVKIADVSFGPLSIQERYLGRVEPIQSALLASNVAGNLIDVRGYPGDTITAGKLLIHIDDRPLLKKVAALKADLEGAKKEFLVREKVLQRNAILIKKHAVSEQQYDFYKMDRDLKKSQIDRINQELENAKIELSYTQITTPFTGTILRRLHEPGENVRPGKPIMEIEDPAKGYKVVLQVPHDVLKHVTAGSKAYISNDGAVIDVKVTRVFPKIFSTETLITVEIDLPQRPFGLQSGATVNVDLVVGKQKGFLVPLRALLENHSQHYVFTVTTKSRVKTIPVSLLGWTEETAAVSGKLAVGDKVIIADEATLLRLAEGAEVLATKDFLP
jgi:RND family efflux transporter MFP subunit